MHPVLFQLPLPSWTVPLFPALLVLAGFGVLLAVFGWRKRAGDLLVIGAVVAVAAGFAAFGYRGQVYTLSPLPIYSYGAMLCLSIVVGWYLTLGLAEKDGLPRDKMANCYFVTALAALVGARLLYVATNSGEFETFRDLFALRRGGLVAYGGFLGGFLGSLVYLRSVKIRLLPWADVAVPSLASGLLITRLGCYLFGCDFGKPLSASAPGWLQKLGTFPRWSDGTLLEGSGSPAWLQHVNTRGLSPSAYASLPVHQKQLYELRVGALLLGLVFFVRRRQSFRGQVFLAFTLGYGALRFLIEIVRDDIERGIFGPYVAEHVLYPLSLLIFAAAFIYGPSRNIDSQRLRLGAQIASLLPGVLLYFVLRPDSFADNVALQLSTSQWIGLLTAVGAAIAWNTLFEASRKNPEAAMSLGPGAVVAEPESAEQLAGEADADEASEPPKKKPATTKGAKKKKRRAMGDPDEKPDVEPA